jgi:hypothetical protein
MEAEMGRAATSTPEGEQQPRHRRIGCLHVLGGAAVALFLAGGYWYYELSNARKEFLAHAEALVCELEASRPNIPEEENALPLYEKAFKLYVRPGTMGSS